MNTLEAQWPDSANGVWVGGRVYNDEFGDLVFIPMGTPRSECPTPGPLTFLGDGVRNVRGWGDPEEPLPRMMEVILTNPVRP